MLWRFEDENMELLSEEFEQIICLDSNMTWTIAWTDEDKADMVVWVCLDWDPGPDKLQIHDVGPGFVYVRGYIKPAGELEVHPE
jgi:hypothetical protein